MGVGPLDVRLAVEIETATGCPLQGRDLDKVKQTVTRPNLDDRETCQVVTENTDTSDYQRTQVGDACPCAVFDEHDCIAEIESVKEGRLTFSLVMPSREILRTIIEDLRAVGTTVSVEQIRTGTVGEDEPTDGITLTQKQQKALAIAIESGYYDQPRDATLEDLADKLDVTPSAVSQRLNAIERKLVRERANEVK